MKNIFVILLITLFSSCYENKSCEQTYIGTFYIDTILLKDSIRKSNVSKYRWDTVKLISTNDGHYYFSSEDKVLKASEGFWYTKSDNIEGECFGFIKQKNLREAVILPQFDITIFASDSIRFSLPFHKRGNISN